VNAGEPTDPTFFGGQFWFFADVAYSIERDAQGQLQCTKHADWNYRRETEAYASPAALSYMGPAAVGWLGNGTGISVG
jgi:hypothetical protein